MALAGAEMLFYPSAIGWDPRDDEEEKVRQRNAWMVIQKSHAIANNLPVISSNRVGFEADPADGSKGTEFWGSSFIAGQQGELLAKAVIDKPAVIIAEIDTGRTDTVRRIWPYFRDRRIDAYQDIVKRHIE
jgi:N-carbamoylputrescine amidase